MKGTHTYVLLEISEGTYSEIRRKLEEAGYQHCFNGEEIDMHGIALVKEVADAKGDA